MSGIWKDEVENGIVTESNRVLNDIHIRLHGVYTDDLWEYYMLNCWVGRNHLISNQALDSDFDIVVTKAEAIELIKNLTNKLTNGLSLLDIGE